MKFKNKSRYRETINIKTIRKYKITPTRLKEFETKHKTKLKHIDIGLHFFTNFVSFPSIEGGYSKTTINKYISQVKMFCKAISITPNTKAEDFMLKEVKHSTLI
ncbi:phage integrase SAM-like domain-containing protein [Mariniflexile sp. HMF6888]|uniref:phage integrase SAM-like domain-containing protein n=1 Tax=Mariniflexile sp. HMF6888 TaxID=3373086 RepID=UPI00378CF320